jgi:hypothetical protein
LACGIENLKAVVRNEAALQCKNYKGSKGPDQPFKGNLDGFFFDLCGDLAVCDPIGVIRCSRYPN